MTTQKTAEVVRLCPATVLNLVADMQTLTTSFQHAFCRSSETMQSSFDLFHSFITRVYRGAMLQATQSQRMAGDRQLGYKLTVNLDKWVKFF